MIRRLVELNDNDFEGISLSSRVTTTNCVILFEDDNAESISLHEVMASTASSISSTICYVLMSKCPRLMNSSNSVKLESGSPLKGFAFRSFPCIITYHNRNPVGYYRGPRNAETISNYILTVAFQPDYYEPHDIIGGVTLDKNLEIPGVNTYTNTPDRPNTVARTSLELPPKMRGYDSKLGVVEAGTVQEVQGLQKLKEDINGSPSSSAIPPSSIPSSAIPPSSIPSSAIPPSSIPSSAIPPSSIPSSAIPPSSSSSAIPPSSIPSSAIPPSSSSSAIPSSAIPSNMSATKKK